MFYSASKPTSANLVNNGRSCLPKSSSTSRDYLLTLHHKTESIILTTKPPNFLLVRQSRGSVKIMRTFSPERRCWQERPADVGTYRPAAHAPQPRPGALGASLAFPGPVARWPQRRSHCPASVFQLTSPSFKHQPPLLTPLQEPPKRSGVM